MSEDIGAGALPLARPQVHAGRFDSTSIALHWLTVALLAAQFTTAWLMMAGGDSVPLFLAAHRSSGVLIWMVAAIRLVWRHRYAHLPPFPASMPALQQKVATLSEYGLYALLLLQPLTGLGNTLLRGRPFLLFGWQIPALLEPHQELSMLLRSAHNVGAAAFSALIGLHAAAALFHAVVLRDGVLQRMLPWTER